MIRPLPRKVNVTICDDKVDLAELASRVKMEEMYVGTKKSEDMAQIATLVVAALSFRVGHLHIDMWFFFSLISTEDGSSSLETQDNPTEQY